MGSEHYRGSIATPVRLAGKQFVATVHLAEVDGRTQCVGIDLRSVTITDRYGPDGQLTHRDVVPYSAPPLTAAGACGSVGWNELNASAWRQMRVAEVVAELASDASLVELWNISRTDDEAVRGRLTAEWVPSRNEQGPPRRGPKPVLDRAGLERVARAYLAAPRGREMAVQHAIQAYLGDKQLPSKHRAKKAISAAKREGLIPPSDRGKQEETIAPVLGYGALAAAARAYQEATTDRTEAVRAALARIVGEDAATTDLAAEAITKAKDRGVLQDGEATGGDE